MNTQPNSSAGMPAAQTGSTRWLNLPNSLTMGRIGLAVIIFVMLALYNWFGFIVPMILFIMAAGTDWLDGYLARRLGLVTALGRVLDPFADKLIICGTFVFLTAHPKMLETTWGLQPWIVVVVISRELLITGLRSFLEGQTVDFSARFSGKLKMFFQCILVIVAMLYLAEVGAGTALENIIYVLLVVSTYVTLLTTLYSGGVYVVIGLRQIHKLEGSA